MKVILLTNSSYVGDTNQLKGIQSAIQAKIKEAVKFIETEESDLDVLTLEADDIILASGSHGILMADKIKAFNPKIKVIWSGHQYFSEFDSTVNMPDIVALPETALPESKIAIIKQKTQLVLTTGVAHSVNDKTVTDDHVKFKGELPDHEQFSRQVGIVLAGDAPTSDNQMKFFTEEDARAQAALIAKYIKTNGFDIEQTAILITNGPRTGKYNPITGLVHDPEPHRSGQVDKSSQAFIDTLKERLSQSHIFFYDFQFDQLKFGPSAYKPMIKQVADSQQGLWFVPAESTSMVTESSFFLESKTPVVIYHPASENSAHFAHAQDAVEQGFALDIANEKISFKLPIKKMESAATKIAEAFYHYIVLAKNKKVSSVNSTMYGAGDSDNDATINPKGPASVR